MVVWSTIEASCPMCRNRVRLREVGSGFSIGQDSDLFVRMKGKHIIQAEVHTCHHCRFSGYTEDFLRDISSEARSRFVKEVAPGLVDEAEDTRTTKDLEGLRRVPKTKRKAPAGKKKSGKLRRCRTTPLPHIQYEWASRAAAAIGLSAHEQAKRLLRAYWCLRISPSSNLSDRTLKRLRKNYLQAAIRKFRQELRFQKDPNLVYVVAELCRRNGNYSLATNYFRRFVEREQAPAKYLREAATKLLEFAQDENSAELSMEELLYNPAPEPEDD